MAFQLDEAIAVLRRTPATLRAMLTGLPEAWLTATEGPDTWSPRDVVAHLADLEETDWMPRVRWIREHGTTRALEPIDRVRFRKVFGDRPVADLLDVFAQRRAQCLDQLDALRLGLTQLDAPGVHPDLGEVTLGQLLASWVVHDFTHIVQISRTMAKRYEAEVGPWKAYLSVLAPRR